MAAGQTPYKNLDKSYVNYIAEKINLQGYSVKLNNYGVPGYTSDNILADIKAHQKGLKAAILQADVITIDVGANDILKEITMDNSTGSITISPSILDTVNRVTLNLGAIIAQIQELNPGAKIYIMGYYNPFPYLPADTQIQLLPYMAGFNAALQLVAQSAGVEFVPTAEAIAGSWWTYIPNPADIHLSQEGYQAVANEFWEVMEIEFPAVQKKTAS